MMSDHNKLNIYINSKHRRTDETPSNFNVIIPDGLLKVNNDEDFELTVVSFFVIIIFIIVIITLINFKSYLEGLIILFI